MCRGFLHQHAPGGGKEFKAASPPSLSLGAIGLGAALSAMAVLLRKENIWQNLEIYNGVFQIPTVQAISGYMENVFLKAPLSCGKLKKSFSSTEALSRLSRVSSSETMKKLSSTLRNTFKSYRRRAALKAITRKECFAKLEYIGQLSIHDIIILFRYANDVNQMDFQKKRFMLEQSQLVRSMVTAVDMAVAMSRGGQKLKLMVNIERKKGEVDALYFTAVVRIFAEWRSMRLVPEGYSRYAVGLNLAYRDILQNLAKIEDGVHAYMKHYGATPEDDVPLCPTLREVLEFEIETRVHQKLPNLKDGSAASGLLWTKRQLHYQSSLFLNTLQVPYKFATTQAGLAAAYSEVYDQYHGWAIKQIFSHSFVGSPPLEVILRQMHPRSEESQKQKTNHCAPTYNSFSAIEDSEALDNEFLAAIEAFGKQISRKWEDVLRFFNCVDDDDDRQNGQNLIMSRESYLDMTGFDSSSLGVVRECPSEDSGESPIASDPLEDVKTGSFDFVHEIRPLLHDISGMIEEFNMNDPSRV